MDRNCLSYWFPRLRDAGLPVPKTETLHTEVDLCELLDGRTPDGYSEFLSSLVAAAAHMGFPCFLRTGQGSGKHDWKNTCFIASAADMPAHIAALVEWSHLVDFFGLAHDVWCVRELLPVAPVAVLPRYGNMPLVKEVRAFIKGGRVVCHHPYWPDGAIADGMECVHGTPHVGFMEDEPERCSRCMAEAESLCVLPPDEVAEAITLAERVAGLFADDGAWSVDLLATNRGWFVTDMAIAARSYHEAGCEYAAAFKEVA